MEFLIFYQKWFMILLHGWRSIFIQLFKDVKNILKGFQLSFWILIILSFILITLVAIPWYSYTIHFSGEEEIFIRTKKWYIFVIPGMISLLLIWYFTKYSYKIQMTINIMMILLYIYGMIKPNYHVQIQGEYNTQLAYYIYILVLLLHTLSLLALKQKENYIINQIIMLWKMKTKRNI